MIAGYGKATPNQDQNSSPQKLMPTGQDPAIPDTGPELTQTTPPLGRTDTTTSAPNAKTPEMVRKKPLLALRVNRNEWTPM